MLRLTCNLFAITALLLPAAAGRWYWHESRGVAAETTHASGGHDGQHDFDFYVGKWHLHNRRLVHPLSGSKEWVEFDGTSVARKMWDGRANVDEFEADSPMGRIEGMTVRLYNADTHEWSIYWANGKAGAFSMPPTVGRFTQRPRRILRSRTDQRKADVRAIHMAGPVADAVPLGAGLLHG